MNVVRSAVATRDTELISTKATRAARALELAQADKDSIYWDRTILYGGSYRGSYRGINIQKRNKKKRKTNKQINGTQ